MLIVFEGMDRVGKTTLIKEISKATGYEFLVLDRGPVGHITYDELLNRTTDERLKSYKTDIMNLVKMNSLFVYLYASDQVIKYRLELEGESLPLNTNISKTKEIYRQNFERYYPSYDSIFIDTSEGKIEECINLILVKTKQIKERVQDEKRNKTSN